MSFNQAPRLPPNLDLLDGSVPVKRHSADPQRSASARKPKIESKTNEIQMFAYLKYILIKKHTFEVMNTYEIKSLKSLKYPAIILINNYEETQPYIH